MYLGTPVLASDQLVAFSVLARLKMVGIHNTKVN